MRSAVLPALLSLLLPAAAHAQSSQGWELRASLEQASASVCTAGGACFGVVCTATGGWAPQWFADVVPQGEGSVPDPILAIRTDGGRFALTSLVSGSGATGQARRYSGPVTADDQPLMEALQAGESLEVDPGRDFALAEFNLRGSRWAVTEAMDLCEQGGPDAFNTPVEEDDG